MREPRRPAYLSTVSVERTPTLASLAQARARQRATLRILRPLSAAVVLLVGVAGSQSQPRPGLEGERLGILLALAGLAAGAAGLGLAREARDEAQAPFFVVLVLSAATLVWLQPNGPGFIGVFVAVGAAAMRLRGSLAIAVAAVAVAALAGAHALSGEHSLASILLAEFGVLAFFAIALLSRRLREGQERAEELLAELEQSRDAQAQAAVLGERQRLAREMHDVLAHSLSGLVLQLEGARLLAARGADRELAGAIARAHHLARSGLEEARRAIGMLRDDELPGPERLPALADEFERDTGIRCETTVTGEGRELDSEARLTIYRVAQEALTNVRKHARPERVELRLGYEPAGARLTVEDFGERPPSDGDRAGYGLTGMRERAELLRGTLAAAPTRSGFRVELWVPS
jgi:signal transduction histidine kinase